MKTVELMNGYGCNQVMLFGKIDAIKYFYNAFIKSGWYLPKVDNVTVTDEYVGLFVDIDENDKMKIWIGADDDAFIPVYDSCNRRVIYNENDTALATRMVARFIHNKYHT